jgi:hypothetical protein
MLHRTLLCVDERYGTSLTVDSEGQVACRHVCASDHAHDLHSVWCAQELPLCRHIQFGSFNRTKLHLRQEQDVFEDIKALPKVSSCSVDATGYSEFLTLFVFRRKASLTNFGYVHVWTLFQFDLSTHELRAPTQHRLYCRRRPARSSHLNEHYASFKANNLSVHHITRSWTKRKSAFLR